MICPRCMYEQADATECVKCGVVIEKCVLADRKDTFSDTVLPGDMSGKVNLKPLQLNNKRVFLSSSSKIFLFAVIAIALGYTAIVFFNDLLAKRAVKAEILVALENELKGEIKSEVFAEKIAEIAKNHKMEMELKNVKIEFIPDETPIRDNNIYYTINITAPYKIAIIGYRIDSIITVTSTDSIPDNTMKANRFKSMLEIQY